MIVPDVLLPSQRNEATLAYSGAINFLVKPGGMPSNVLSRPGAVGKLLALQYRA